MKKASITLDAGHGGKDPGAVGLRGRREKDVCLAVTTRLAMMLQAAGVTVKQTRMDDRFLELAERAEIANAAGTDLFLSIHCNAADNRAASGFEVFTTPGQTEADAFATCLFEEFARVFPTKLKRMDLADGDVDKEARFTVLTRTRMPAALFELDFISNPAVEAWLGEPLNQISMAEALCDGVLKHLGASGSREQGDARREQEDASPAFVDDLLVPLEKARGLNAEAEACVAELSDAELLALLGAVAGHEDIHGAAGELMGMAVVESSARWIREKQFQDTQANA
jgi:N-acetylmuramoyl-L-alanine amidase